MNDSVWFVLTRRLKFCGMFDKLVVGDSYFEHL